MDYSPLSTLPCDTPPRWVKAVPVCDRGRDGVIRHISRRRRNAGQDVAMGALISERRPVEVGAGE